MRKLSLTKLVGEHPLRDLLLTLALLGAAVGLCLLIRLRADGNIYVFMMFVLAVLMAARFTGGYLYGILASVAGMFLVNYVFIYPYMAFNFTISGYPLTFVSLLAVSLTTSAMTSQVKEQEKVRSAASRERMRGDLLRAISHDLRTPLTGILGASSALMEDAGQLDEAGRRALAAGIQEDAQWLLRMVENLLSITRIGDRTTRISKAPEPAEEVVGAALSKIFKRYPGWDIQVSAPQALLMVPMDALLIQQVLINLLENAIRHGVTAQHISLTVKQVQDQALFLVEDDGRGIPQEALPHLFEGAQPADRSSDATRGMGIGLSACKAIIQAHGGRIWAANREEGGAALYFTLPLEEELHE